MSGYVIGCVLFAACLHAIWNTIVKSAGDKRLTMVIITSTAGLLSAALLPWVTQPAAASWPFIAASMSAQCVYYVLVASAYRLGDLSHTYPLMRGSAPLLVAAASGLLIGEPLSGARWLGVGLICTGVLGLALHRRVSGTSSSRASALALGNALVIASYTLIDGVGVRRSHAPLGYTLWLFMLTGACQLSWALLWRRTALLAYARSAWRAGLIGGSGTVTSYGIALWAMTLAPVALVAALRETSILFGTVLAVTVLGERVTLQRALSTLLIGAGAVALRLA